MSTTQLKRGGAHEKSFEDICPNYGLKVVKQWGSGNKNKKNNCDADFTVEIVNLKMFETIVTNKKFKTGQLLTVSCKTEKGAFTLANLGTGPSSGLYKRLLNEEENNELIMYNNEMKAYKESIGNEKRWSEVGNDKKDFIFELHMLFNYLLFQNRKSQEILYDWLEERQSDLKYVGNKLYLQNSKKIPKEYIKVEMKGKNTIIIGDYRLRFKAAGGKVCSSWKINVELNQ